MKELLIIILVLWSFFGPAVLVSYYSSELPLKKTIVLFFISGPVGCFFGIGNILINFFKKYFDEYFKP